MKRNFKNDLNFRSKIFNAHPHKRANRLDGVLHTLEGTAGSSTENRNSIH